MPRAEREGWQGYQPALEGVARARKATLQLPFTPRPPTQVAVLCQADPNHQMERKYSSETARRFWDEVRMEVSGMPQPLAGVAHESEESGDTMINPKTDFNTYNKGLPNWRIPKSVTITLK